MCDNLEHISDKWPSPKHRDVGLFTNASLYVDALVLISESKLGVNEDILKSELGPRRIGLAERRPIFDAGEGLISYKGVSQRVASDLLKELSRFDWINKDVPQSAGNYFLTEKGQEAIIIHKRNAILFRRIVVLKLQELYTVPGWFIQRLWKINADHQGEVFIPMPNKKWAPPSWKWENKSWTSELEQLTTEAIHRSNQALPGSLPIKEETWIKAARDAWDRLGNLKPKQFRERDNVERFSPRKRLTMAMKEAAIELLFHTIPSHSKSSDVYTRGARKYIISPKSPRMLQLWTARMEDLNMLFYTDNLKDAPGRLIFPVSVFLPEASSPDFIIQDGVSSPEGESLFYHMPNWKQHSKTFMSTLYDVHWGVSRRVGSFYVSLLDVRDEVCRQIRISATWFDELLEQAVISCLQPGAVWSLSIESDVREDQRSAHGLLRRPVWQGATPYSLIAIRKRTDP